MGLRPHGEFPPDRSIVLRRFRSATLLVIALLPAFPRAGGAAPANITLQVRDAQGAPLPARVNVKTASDAWPSLPDTALLSRELHGRYFYTEGDVVIPASTAPTHLVVGQGFERAPADLWITPARDTTVTVVLPRLVNLRASGWYGADLHVHTRHGELEYALTPTQLRRVARAEDLAVLFALDQGSEFTGGAHAVSDSVCILDYSYEYRTGVYGHVELPGLHLALGPTGCCVAPAPPYPMLLDQARWVHATGGGVMVLGHPHTTDDYDQLCCWPGSGLGRELPVLAALRQLDGVGLGSYSNQPEVDATDWFDLLSAGFSVPPTAGTDAAINHVHGAPPGGWRVYTQLPPGMPFTLDAWLAGLRRGRCFVTSQPLIEVFDVAGRGMGDSLEVTTDSLVAPVHLRVTCALGLERVELLTDAGAAWQWEFDGGVHPISLDTTFTLRAPTPSWLVLRVEGLLGSARIDAAEDAAYGNALRVTHGGVALSRPCAMARWCDDLDQLESLIASQGTLVLAWQRDSVMTRIAQARQVFTAPFRSAPAPFAMIMPPPNDTLYGAASWRSADDPDPCDRVRYVVRVAGDSSLAGAWEQGTSETSLALPGLEKNRGYWIAVDAVDRAGNARRAGGAAQWFFVPGDSSLLATPPGPTISTPRAFPNPTRGSVQLIGLGRDAVVYDMAGRRVAALGRGLTWSPAGPRWDGRDRGQAAAPGVYWAGGATGARVRIVRLR